MLGSVGVTKQVSPDLDASAAVTVLQGEGGPVLGVEMSAVQSLGHHMFGILQWRHMPNTMSMKTGLLYDGESYSAAAFLQLGLPDSHASARGEVKVLEHTRLKASVKVRLAIVFRFLSLSKASRCTPVWFFDGHCARCMYGWPDFHSARSHTNVSCFLFFIFACYHHSLEFSTHSSCTGVSGGSLTSTIVLRRQ